MVPSLEAPRELPRTPLLGTWVNSPTSDALALLDRGLPDGDGLEPLGELRAVNPDVRVLVISSTVEMRHPTDAIEAGADGVIDKLDDSARVFAAIRGPGA
jgi:two-component system, OmpR family, response regulator